MLAAQLELLKTETLARLKQEGMEYDDRMEVLRELEHPKPLADFLYQVFDNYRVSHPWAQDHNVAPKSIVRDMYERSMSFAEYVAHYKLARSEGLLLRYLSDAYKALDRNVPMAAKTEALEDIIAWLGEMVRQVDSSLLDEWEVLSHPEQVERAVARGERLPLEGGEGPATPPVSANARAFMVMARNACFRRVEMAARRDWDALGEADGGGAIEAARWRDALAPYFSEHDSIGTGTVAARGLALWQVGQHARRWQARQVLDDPAGYHEWAMVFDVDLDASDAEGRPVLSMVSVERS